MVAVKLRVEPASSEDPPATSMRGSLSFSSFAQAPSAVSAATTHPTDTIFTNPREEHTEAYVTGRFG